MNILLIGSGGREHALARSIAGSPLCDRLLIAPGNPGTAQHGTNMAVDVTDHAAVVALCRREAVGLVVVGPEAPLVAGIVDDFAAAGIKAFGPSRAAARLEGSKAFTREFAAEFGIPGAAFGRFTDAEAAKAYIRAQGSPIVVKADGLAAGKGVVVAETVAEAENAVDAMLGGSLGEAGREVLIEECLLGEEASVFALCDGDHAIPLGTAQDHKRALDGDRGPNTGGMGAYSPAPVVTPEVEAAVMDRIIRPTLDGMRRRGTPFVGILYAGLMIGPEGPRLIEYNVRFRRPGGAGAAAAPADRHRGRHGGGLRRRAGRGLAQLVGLPGACRRHAAPGYPGAVQGGSIIGGIDEAERLEHVAVFQAGTARRGDDLVAAGGRVLAVTALGPTVAAAQARAYEAVAAIDWPEGVYRRDIGWRAVERERA